MALKLGATVRLERRTGQTEWGKRHPCPLNRCGGLFEHEARLFERLMGANSGDAVATPASQAVGQKLISRHRQKIARLERGDLRFAQ